MYILKKENLKEVLNTWSVAFEVYAPKENQGEIMLLPYENNELSLDYINFSSSVKEFIFKQREKFFDWTNINGEIEVHAPKISKTKRILFGVRPCDAYGIAYMDKFFLDGFKDELYDKNRQNTWIVAVNCLKPGKDCFCNSVGSGPFASVGYDVLVTEIKDKYLIEVASKKGEELIALGENLFEKTDDKFINEKKVIEDSVKSKFKTVIKVNDVNKVLDDNFDNPIWDELSKDCVTCTGCTSVCPTCTCFNVVEESTGCDSGCRVRYADSCQCNSFTRNAGEHNPRNNISRVRYRIYDKFKYIKEKFNMIGCTGCGRCINVCPASINVVDIINKLGETNNLNETKNLAEIGIAVNQDDLNIGDDVHKETCESKYLPQIAVITDIVQETRNIKHFFMQYEDKKLHENFIFTGQFFEITVFGVGEIAISIPFSPSQTDFFDFCIKKAGKVTSAIHALKVGDKVGLRGPFGKGFPYEELKGRDIIIIGSGVGLAPIRTTIVQMIENKQEFGKIVIIGSAMVYEGLVYRDDLIAWDKIPGVKVLYALSSPTDKVDAYVGVINDLLPGIDLDWKNTSSIICASPRRIKFLAKDLLKLGMKGTDIYTSLETHMRCGIGKCGHCKVGSKYMCVDGPVFNYEEMLKLPPEF